MKLQEAHCPKAYLFSTFIAVMIFTGCKKDINTQAPNDQLSPALTSILQNHPEKYVPNEVLIKFKPGTSQEARLTALSKIGGAVTETVLTEAMKSAGDKEGFAVVHTTLSVLDAITMLHALPTITYVDPNFVYNHDAVATDPFYTNGSLWGMYGDASSPANQYGSQAAEAWAAGHTGSASVYVGVVDEGIQYTHPDLSGQVWTNPYDAVDGIDNDGNGYVDDIHGWDFSGNNNSIYDGGSSGNLDDHGTHVSGTIGAKSSNGIGVVGVNWNITIISTKFLGRNGGTSANAVKAVDYLTDEKNRHGLNIVASNNSWGGGGYSQALADAITRANTKNILFIAAAGNGGSDGAGDNNDATPSYPSNYTVANVIAVAAIDKNGALASFSNYGATSVDLGAPGVGVYSTVASNSYASYSGTSMATPHVTGAAALYASTHPGSSAATIKAAILNSTLPTASLSGKCVTGGRLNAGGF